MAWDAEFTEGFDKYGVATANPLTLMLEGEWSSSSGGSFSSTTLVAALGGTGTALHMVPNTGYPRISKSLAGNYARFIGGLTFQCTPGATAGIIFTDGSTDQGSITFETNNKIGWRGGSLTGSLWSSSAGTFVSGSTHVLEWDISWITTTGYYKVYLDGTLVFSNTGTIRQTANQYANIIAVSPGNGADLVVDHFYNRFFLAAGSADTPLLTSPIIETQFPNANGTVTWTPSSGANYTDVNVNPPGANFVSSSTVGQEDLYAFPALVAVPLAIYGAAVKAQALRNGAGARTLEVHQKSGTTDSAGTLTAAALSTSATYYASYFDTDPNTGAAWITANLNAATAGPKVAS